MRVLLTSADGVIYAREVKRVEIHSLGLVWAEDEEEPAHDCEAELKAHPDYSVGRGTPERFYCSCGRVYGFEDEESCGAWWQLILDPAAWEPKQGCPDGGRCHHGCEASCFRVRTCEPLSLTGWGERWPAAVVSAHAHGGPETLEDVIVGG